MDDVVKAIDKEVMIAVVIIFVGIIVAYSLFIQNLYAIFPDNEKVLKNYYSDMSILLKCESNKLFITDESEITCSVAAKSVNWNYTNTYLIIQAFKDDNGFFGCSVNFPFIGNNSYTNFVECGDGPGKTIVTDVPTNLEFRLYEINIQKAELGNITLSSKELYFKATADDQKPFTPILRVLDKQNEVNAIATNYTYRLTLTILLISVLAIIVSIFVPFTVLRRQIKENRKERLNIQNSLLHTLALELIHIQRDSKGYEDELKRNKMHDIDLDKKSHILFIPQYPIKILDYTFYISSLDRKIGGRDTEKLKDILITIYDKTWLINDSLSILRTRGIIWPDAVVHYKRIDKRFGRGKTGHTRVDLDSALEEALNILKKDFGVNTNNISF